MSKKTLQSIAAADAVKHPSKATRRVLEQIGEGDEFIGINTLTPAFHRALVPLWSYVPAAVDNAGQAVPTQWFVIDPDAVSQAIEDELDMAANQYADRVADSQLAFAPEEYYASAEQAAAALAALPHCIEARTIELHAPAEPDAEPDGDASEVRGDPAASRPGALRLSIDDNRKLRAELEHARRQQADELLKPLVQAVSAWRKQDWRVAIAAGNAERAQKLASLLADYGIVTRRSRSRPHACSPRPGQRRSPSRRRSR